MLLLPAVQAAREGRARRAQCVNNRKQLRPGDAQLPHRSSAHFPIGLVDRLDRTSYGSTYQEGWTDWSCHTLLLGYLEQSPLFNAANFQQTCCTSGQR